MPATCPNCSNTFDPEGYISQEDLVKRLKSKNDEILSQKDEIAEFTKAIERMQDDLKAVDALKTERDQAVADLAGLKSAAELDSAFTAAGVPADDTIRDGFKAIYDSQMAGVEEADKVPYTEWVASDAAKGHVLLKAHYGTPTETTETPVETPATTPAPKSTPKHVPNTESGTKPPPAAPPAKLTPQQLSEFFASKEYKDLPKEQRDAKRAELRSQVLG